MDIKVDADRCSGCGICVQDCPVGAIRLKDKKALVRDECTRCGACVRICPEEALNLDEILPSDRARCDACPIFCWIKEG